MSTAACVKKNTFPCVHIPYILSNKGNHKKKKIKHNPLIMKKYVEYEIITSKKLMIKTISKQTIKITL